MAGGVNLYAYAGNNPVAFTDPFGLEADTLQLRVKRIGLGQHHVSIYIAPDDPEVWQDHPAFDGRTSITLGAASNSTLRSLLGFDAKLVSTVNRPGDATGIVSVYSLDPGPQGENAAISRLLILNSNYGDNLSYCLFPWATDNCYNSNRWTPGILQAADVAVPEISEEIPGYNKPVPESEFR